MQFDFPNENGKPYKSSGGKMVWNEKLKREIPEGWEVLSINQIALSTRGVSYTKDDLVSQSEGVLVLRGNNIQDNNLVFDSNTAYIPSSFISSEQNISKYDIIVTMSSGSKEHIGKSVIFYQNISHTFGAFLSKFSPKEKIAYILWQTLNSQYFKTKIKSIANGTGINNLTNQTFDDIFLAIPPSDVLGKFNSQISLLFETLGTKQQESWNLTQLRDELLPLLMNGQVSVNYDLSHLITFFEPQKVLCIFGIFPYPFVEELGVVFELLHIFGFVDCFFLIFNLLQNFLPYFYLRSDAFRVPLP